MFFSLKLIFSPRYYPYHYAPFLSDIRNISSLKIHFELGKPFKPFEQLLAVLPSASKNLLPTCYQVGFGIEWVFLIFFFKDLFLYVCTFRLHVCISIYLIILGAHKRQIRALNKGTGVMYSCEFPYRCWKDRGFNHWTTSPTPYIIFFVFNSSYKYKILLPKII